MNTLPNFISNSFNGDQLAQTTKFDQLLHYLKQIPTLNISIGFLRNLDILKESIKIERKVPDLDQISSIFKSFFSSK